MCCTYVELFEHGMFFYAGEHDSHGVGSILQEGNLHSVHVIGQFLDVCLQLCKGCKSRREDREVLLLTVFTHQWLCSDTRFWVKFWFYPLEIQINIKLWFSLMSVSSVQRWSEAWLSSLSIRVDAGETACRPNKVAWAQTRDFACPTEWTLFS